MTREEKLEIALDKNMDLINRAQVYIRYYLEPEGQIKTEKELVDKLIYLFDGPDQRLALQSALRCDEYE